MRPPRVHGLAVLEGVMMRTSEAFAVAVRRPTGEVVVRRRKLPPRTGKPWPGQWPLLRGLVAGLDGLYLGFAALWFSLLQDSGTGELATAALGTNDLLAPKRRSGGFATFLGLSLAVLLAPVAQILVPAAIDALCAPGFVLLAAKGQGAWATALAQAQSAVLQLLFLPLYVAGLCKLPALQRLLGYHGAEHKARYAQAHGLPLTRLSVRRAPLHAQGCALEALGRYSALATVLFFALDVGLPTVPPPVDLGLHGQWVLRGAGFWLRSVALLVAWGATYEWDLWRAGRAPPAANWRHGPWSLLSGNSASLREPDAGMVEVALVALQAVLRTEEGPGQAESFWRRRLAGPLVPGTPATRWGRAAAGRGAWGRVRRPKIVRRVEDLCCTN